MKNNYRIPPVIYFSVLVCLLLILPGYVGAQSYNLSGLWISTFGHMNLKMSRGTVSGSYDDGKIKGTLKGYLSSNRTLLAGKWDEGDLQGRFLFKILPGGNTFSGRWWKANSTDAGEWIAVCMEKEVLCSSVSAADYEGEWDTNFGIMTLQVEDQKVTGSFKGKASEGKIEGSVDEKANRLSARWSDERYRGTVVLSLVKGKNGFNGEWWYSDKVYGGVWYGVRKVETLGCLTGNCDDSVGVYLWADGTHYEGDWEDGFYHGIGTVYARDRSVVNKGLWSKGIFQGTPVSGDCKNGFGKLTLPNGDVYEGEFNDCELTGKGKITYQNGDIYEGELLKGVASGNGTYTWADNGNSYSGTFRNGVIHGKGVYTFKNGDQYEGRFLNGARHGQGVYTWANGNRYDGQWLNDRPEGTGTCSYPNGDQYNGNISNGLKTGDGTYTFANGRSVTAKWQEDKIVQITRDSHSEDKNAPPANLLTQHNNPVLNLASAYQTVRDGYLVYKITETEAALAEAPAIMLGDKERSVHLEYYIIYGPGDISQSHLDTYLENYAGIVMDDQYIIEKITNPRVRISQVLDRYRYSLNKPRIHTKGMYFFYREEDIATLK